MSSTFDNRNWLYNAYMRLRQRNGYPHFLFHLDGKKIIYCYIRKNACSAFKRMLVDLSDVEAKPSRPEERAAFLFRHHLARYPHDFKQVDHTIFVHRDPTERAISLFRNKFIQRSGSGDIFKSYEAQTGRSPETASFKDFVTHYLTGDMRRIDPHVLAQRRHLLPIIYSDAIEMGQLHETMCGVIGSDLADRYFLVRTNQTTGLIENDCGDVSNIPADKLAQTYESTNTLPPHAAFVTPDIAEQLDDVYRSDSAFRSGVPLT